MKPLRSSKGSTMVEVLVALVVVMLMMTVFAAAVTTSMELIRRSESLLDTDESFWQTCYRQDSTLEPVTGRLSLTDQQTGAGIPLPDTGLEQFTHDNRTLTTFGKAP